MYLANFMRLYSQCQIKMTTRPLVMCGPSGAGKSTLIKYLMAEFKEKFGFSVSHTTRAPRSGEKDGVHYHFVSGEVMEDAIDRGEFLETAQFSGNIYGTSKQAVEKVAKSGRICILDIDMQGVISIKQTDLNPFYVFIKPPSEQDLETRLRGRGTETEDSLKRRLSVARKEMDYGSRAGNFDVIIVNDDAERAYQDLRAFILPALRSQDGTANHQGLPVGTVHVPS